MFSPLAKLNNEIVCDECRIKNHLVLKNDIPETPQPSSSLTGFEFYEVPEFKPLSMDYDWSWFDARLDEISGGATYKKLEKREATLSELESALIEMRWWKRAESFANLKVSFYDVVDSQFIVPDKILLNDQNASYSMKYENNRYNFYIKQLCPEDYKIRILKDGYLPVYLNMKSQFAERLSDVEQFDLGSVNMLKLVKQLRFILTWRRDS